jgi:hypothetical protein
MLQAKPKGHVMMQEVPSIESLSALNGYVAVYVPSTVNVTESIAPHRHEALCKYVSQVLSELFGGATSYNAVGAYKSNAGSMVYENVTVVKSFGKQQDILDNWSAIYNMAAELREELAQEYVSVEVNGALAFVG